MLKYIFNWGGYEKYSFSKINLHFYIYILPSDIKNIISNNKDWYYGIMDQKEMATNGIYSNPKMCIKWKNENKLIRIEKECKN